MSIVTLPAMYVPDPTKSRALFYAKIYIGLADSDPTLPENQKPARLVQEDGSVVDAEYPIRTNEGGVPVYNGSEVSIDVDGDYSMSILDRNDAQIYYFANQVESSTVLQSNLNTIATLVDLTYDDIGVSLVTDQEGSALDDAIILFNTATGEIFDLPRNIPTGSEVVSISGSQLVTTNGTFTVYKRYLLNEVTPRDEQWNGFFTIDHLTPLPSLAGLPATSGSGGTVYDVDEEFTLNNFSSAASNTISLDDDGLIFSEGIYKLFTYTEEQLDLIDVEDVPVYIVGQDGSQHFIKHNGAGVVVTKPDTTTLKVQINNAILTELNITKVLYFFVTNNVGVVPVLSPDEGRHKNQPKLYADALVNGTTNAFIQNLGFTGIIAGATGVYTISFDELPDTDYYFEANIVVSARVCIQPNASAKTTTSVTFRITDFAGVAYEPDQFSVRIKVR